MIPLYRIATYPLSYYDTFQSVNIDGPIVTRTMNFSYRGNLHIISVNGGATVNFNSVMHGAHREELQRGGLVSTIATVEYSRVKNDEQVITNT